jgi:hypothetical protein
MRLFRLKSVLSIAVAALFILAACNNASKTRVKKGETTDGKSAYVETEVFDIVKVKDQIVEIILNSPSVEELAQLLNQSGASYIFDLTVPFENAEKFMTATQQSLGLGVYAFDYQYASVYNRADIVSQITQIEGKLVDNLGLTAEIKSSEEYMQRMRDNADNKDSINSLVTHAINFSHQQVANSDHPDVYALAFIAANVEALYVLSQLTLMATNNTEMLKLIANQKERAKSIFSLLEIMSADESVAPYYEKMVPIMQYFEEARMFGQKELEEVSPMIEKLRNSML